MILLVKVKETEKKKPGLSPKLYQLTLTLLGMNSTKSKAVFV